MLPARAAGRGEGGGAGDRGVDGDPARRGRTRALLRAARRTGRAPRSEEHTSELQSLMRISYAVFCLKKKKKTNEYSSTDDSYDNDTRTLGDTKQVQLNQAR